MDYLLLFERRRQLKEGSVHIVKREKERKATISRVAVERKNIRKKTKTVGKKLFDQSASANVKRRVSVCHSRRMCIDSCKYIQPKIADEFPYRGIKLSLSLSLSRQSRRLYALQSRSRGRSSFRERLLSGRAPVIIYLLSPAEGSRLAAKQKMGASAETE